MVFRTYTDEVRRQGTNTKSFEAAEAILQGQLVKLDTDSAGRTVEPSDTDGEAGIIGFAEYDAAAGDDVSVCMTGCEVRATSGTGTVTSGDPVASHGGTGEEGEVDTAATGDTPIGIAIADDNGDGGDVWVIVDAGFGAEVN